MEKYTIKVGGGIFLVKFDNPNNYRFPEENAAIVLEAARKHIEDLLSDEGEEKIFSVKVFFDEVYYSIKKQGHWKEPSAGNLERTQNKIYGLAAFAQMFSTHPFLS